MQSSPTPPPNLQAANPPWNPIIISLVGAICTLFLFLSYYKILCRFCFNLCGILLGDRSQRRLLNEANPADDPSLQFQSRALDSVTLEMLPAIQFRKKVDDVEAGEEGADCSVCLGELEEGEWLRLLPNCAHVFHIACIDAWFRTHSNCPLCRFNVSYNYDSYHRYATSLFATLSREDVHGERAVDYWDFGSGNLLNPGCWCREIDSSSFNREFWAGVNSPSLIAALRYQQNVGYLRKEDQDLRASSSWIEGDCENQSS